MNLVELRELSAFHSGRTERASAGTGFHFRQYVIICLFFRMDVHCLLFVCNLSGGLDVQSPRDEEIKFYCMPKALIIITLSCELGGVS